MRETKSVNVCVFVCLSILLVEMFSSSSSQGGLQDWRIFHPGLCRPFNQLEDLTFHSPYKKFFSQILFLLAHKDGFESNIDPISLYPCLIQIQKSEPKSNLNSMITFISFAISIFNPNQTNPCLS